MSEAVASLADLLALGVSSFSLKSSAIRSPRLFPSRLILRWLGEKPKDMEEAEEDARPRLGRTSSSPPEYITGAAWRMDPIVFIWTFTFAIVLGVLGPTTLLPIGLVMPTPVALL